MLKNYQVKYWDKDGRIVAMQVSAQSGLDAKAYAENLPNFKTLVNYPQEIKQS